MLKMFWEFPVQIPIQKQLILRTTLTFIKRLPQNLSVNFIKVIWKIIER